MECGGIQRLQRSRGRNDVILIVTTEQTGTIPGFFGVLGLQKESAGLDSAKREDVLVSAEGSFDPGESFRFDAEDL